MTQELESLEEIKRINSSFPLTDPVREWKAEGKKVVGWTCINVPEEIIHAAGILPYRIIGGAREVVLKEANAWMYSNVCSFARTCLELELRGEYDFLDGIVGSTPCEGVIRLAEVGEYAHEIPLIHLLDVPRKIVERSYDYYLDELKEFKQKVERFSGAGVSDQALADSIELYNKTRASFRKLHELRKLDEPPISGTEMMELLNAAVRMPRERFNEILDKLFSELETTKRALPKQARLMISGTVLNNTEFVKGIEDLGVTVVADDVCTGSRYWWESVVDGGTSDPLTALSRRYMATQCPCPRLYPPDVRTDWILDTVKEFKIDGVIALTIRSCSPYIHDMPLWRWTLQEKGTQVLDLDVEYGSDLSGQIQVRVEAFIEMITGEGW